MYVAIGQSKHIQYMQSTSLVNDICKRLQMLTLVNVLLYTLPNVTAKTADKTVTEKGAVSSATDTTVLQITSATAH